MAADLAKTVADLVQTVRQGQGALLMAMDGVPVEQAGSAGGVDLDAIAGEYSGLLQQAKALAEELGCGAPRRFSVRGRNRQLVFAFVSGDLVLGAEAGPAGLHAQMRRAVAQAAGQLGEL
jgi:predicted regulator of Ras-like GTPase activity (Roadblock/LC7/MglB family)